MKLLPLLALCILPLIAVQTVSAHCQVPCGIYGDELKFGELEQHIDTITKASAQITEISAKDTLTAQDQQQLIRWTNNKESHAQKIIDESANYFLAQRIKPDADHYAKKVELLHHIIVYSMKSKQSTDGAAAKTLDEKLAAFKAIYLDHTHTH
ncbi:MAG: superoxide dismutase [Ni] [Opitutaceae bacterium]